MLHETIRNDDLRSLRTRRQVAVTCLGDTSERQIASCKLENFSENLCFCNRSLSQQHVAKKSNQTEFVRLVAATKFCCRDKDFHKISPGHTKRFVTAMCRRNMLLQLVAGPVHTEWSVAAICCCNLSPIVYRPLFLAQHSVVTLLRHCFQWLQHCSIIIFNIYIEQITIQEDMIKCAFKNCSAVLC